MEDHKPQAIRFRLGLPLLCPGSLGPGLQWAAPAGLQVLGWTVSSRGCRNQLSTAARSCQVHHCLEPWQSHAPGPALILLRNLPAESAKSWQVRYAHPGAALAHWVCSSCAARAPTCHPGALQPHVFLKGRGCHPHGSTRAPELLVQWKDSLAERSTTRLAWHASGSTQES